MSWKTKIGSGMAAALVDLGCHGSAAAAAELATPGADPRSGNPVVPARSAQQRRRPVTDGGARHVKGPTLLRLGALSTRGLPQRRALDGRARRQVLSATPAQGTSSSPRASRGTYAGGVRSPIGPLRQREARRGQKDDQGQTKVLSFASAVQAMPDRGVARGVEGRERARSQESAKKGKERVKRKEVALIRTSARAQARINVGAPIRPPGRAGPRTSPSPARCAAPGIRSPRAERVCAARRDRWRGWPPAFHGSWNGL